MIKALPTQRIPDWLAALDAGQISNSPFPLLDLLKESLYYPASGLDGDPIMRLGGNVHSFVYVDQGVTDRVELLSMLASPRCFRGYELIAARDVSKEELTPRGWTPTAPLPEDGRADQFSHEMKPPFAMWAIMQRLAGQSSQHGPERFSLSLIHI